MKTSLLAIALLFTFAFKGSTQPIFADPATSQIELTSLGGVPLNANSLGLNQPILLRIPVFNNSQGNPVPAGSIKLRVGLSTKIVMDPGFDLANSALGDYFAWTSSFNNGQVEIIGDLVIDLPPDFIDYAVFRVKPNVLSNGTTTTITTNVSVTNHNTANNLSDLDPANNTASLQYTVVAAGGPLPVNFTKLNVGKKGCAINFTFFTEQEVNVDHYEIEASRNGSQFTKVGMVVAEGKASYSKEFPITKEIEGTNLLVRVKSVDRDGNVKYSETRAVSGKCDPLLVFNIYPNPVVSETIAVRATSGLFNGKYQVVVMDMSGRVVHSQKLELQNAAQYQFRPATIATGKYIMKLSTLDGSQSGVVPFEKL